MWLARVPVPSGFAAAMASMSMDGIPLVLRFSSGYVGVITYSNNIVAVIDAASKAGLVHRRRRRTIVRYGWMEIRDGVVPRFPPKQ